MKSAKNSSLSLSGTIGRKRTSATIGVTIDPKIAIIIDDFGYEGETIELFISLGIPLTFAVLPKLPFSEKIATQARQRGYEVILHLPMEPQNAYENDPGKLAIWTHMTENQIRQMLEETVASIPGLVGVNNHMGSKATANKPVMRVLMKELRQRNLFFIDSLTTANSVAYQVAKAHNLPTARNQIFLDNRRNLDDIKEQIWVLADVAIRRGSAIGTGHAHAIMAQATRESLPMLQDLGIHLVFASQLVE